MKLLDIEAASSPLLTDLGEEASKALFTFVDAGHPNSPDGAQDDTHLSLTGALKLAEIALELLKSC